MKWMMTGTPSGGAFSLACFAVAHNKHRWMVPRWSPHGNCFTGKSAAQDRYIFD